MYMYVIIVFLFAAESFGKVSALEKNMLSK